ncbi:exported hypothetical protein [metagenome]|uniref:Glycosyl hydrolase family 98 putative carbohydrate-binding module domain-containing protein n=1 Tax=metagenome TaxID=256318 RepID=A0A2P2C3N1_9ZZZZ
MHRSAVAAAALVALAPVAALTSTSTARGPATGMADVAAVPTYSVAARISASEVVSGEETVKVRGTVRPRAAGQVVVLQQRSAGSRTWRRSGQGRVRANGRFVLSDSPSTPGVRFYRVLKPASRAAKAGTSRELRLEVWRWEPLVHRVVGAHGGIEVGSVQIGGQAFPDSIVTTVAGEAGHATYVLGGSCRTLRATYGLADTSSDGASGRIAILDPGGGLSLVFLETGTIERDRVTDLTGTIRVRLEMLTTSTPAGYAAIGMPEVLCLD